MNKSIIALFLAVICPVAAAQLDSDDGNLVTLTIPEFEPEDMETYRFHIVELRRNGHGMGEAVPTDSGVLFSAPLPQIRAHLPDGTILPPQPVLHSYYFYTDKSSGQSYYGFDLRDVPLDDLLDSLSSSHPMTNRITRIRPASYSHVAADGITLSLSQHHVPSDEVLDVIRSASGCAILIKAHQFIADCS